jgi:hypothetical protein
MINQADEIPVTYLNKGHVYSVFIVDSAPTMPRATPVQYRTSIRISFEDREQGQGPATRWQIWKEGRGTAEAHHRNGKLQGVEYVEARDVTEDDSRTRVNLETASVDGFSVLWAQGLGGSAECHIAVRFNFLSTDFSHSKGIKGILSRLCAKTEVISTDSLYCTPDVPEICFCKVKVFRDHGAERKLFNDVECVKKTIDKLKQLIAQAETGMKDHRKRKRSGSITTKVTRNSGPGKALKHAAEEDLPFKLQTMQDMFASSRPLSVLYVRGQEQDDPDLHPIQLTGEPLGLMKVEPEESTAWQQRISGRSIDGTSTLRSPLPSPGSAQSRGIVHSGCETSAGAELPTHVQRGRFQSTAPTSKLQQSNFQLLPSPPDQPVEVQMWQQDSPSTSTRGIEPFKVDSSPIPPSELPVKPGTFSSFMHSEKLC